MLEQVTKLIEAGKLSAVNLKVSVLNGQPVVIMSAQTDGVDMSVLQSDKGVCEEAREQIVAVRNNLARPVVFQGADIATQLQQAVPVLTGSYVNATENVDALSVAAKLDGAVAKARPTVEKAKQPPAKSSGTKSIAKDKPKAAKSEVKKDASNATTDTVNDEGGAAPAATPSAEQVTDAFNFDSL